MDFVLPFSLLLKLYFIPVIKTKQGHGGDQIKTSFPLIDLHLMISN